MKADLLDRLLEPDWHDPACPFRNHCYCDDGAPHDAVRHPLAREAADEIASLRARVGELETAGRYIKPYLVWTVGDESPGHHPTMPSAVGAFLDTLNAQGIEAGTVETERLDAKHESPVVEDHAPDPSTQTHTTKKKGE